MITAKQLFSSRFRTKVFLCLLLLVFLVYGKSLFYGFVYDDHWTVETNSSIRSLESPVRFFLFKSTVSHPATLLAEDVYRPLPTLSFAVDYSLWGLSPMWIHFENLLLHALNGFLLFLCLSNRFRLPKETALLAAGIFLFHPVQIESAVWMTQRSNLLCLCGMLLAFYFLVQRDEKNLTLGKAAIGLSGVLLALLSKEVAVVFFPLLLMGQVAMNEKPFSRKYLHLYLFIFCVTVGYLLLRGEVLGRLAQKGLRTENYFGDLMMGALAFLHYIKLLFIPVPLQVSYWQATDWRAIDNAWNHPENWIGALLFISVCALILILWMKGKRTASYGFAWFLLPLLPVLGFIPTKTFVAERFLYIPMIGVASLVAVAWLSMLDKMRVKRKLVRVGVPLLPLLTLTYLQVAPWKNDVSLWKNSVKSDPENPHARIRLAGAYEENREFERAIKTYEEVLLIDPPENIALASTTSIGRVYNAMNRPLEAIKWSDRALEMDEMNAWEAVYNKVISLVQLDETESAFALIGHARSVYPPEELWDLLREKIEANAESSKKEH